MNQFLFRFCTSYKINNTVHCIFVCKEIEMKKGKNVQLSPQNSNSKTSLRVKKFVAKNRMMVLELKLHLVGCFLHSEEDDSVLRP